MTLRRDELAPIGLSILIFAALLIAAAITSQGFLEADACTHFLQAKFAFQQPHYFVNIWGRPIFTMLYALPAMLFGIHGATTMSLLLAIGTSLVAYRIAINQGYRWPALALIFTLAQPLVFLHSFSEMTELPFALLIGLAFWMYQTKRFGWMALLAGLSPLSRPEGFGFLALVGLPLVMHRRWILILLLPVPLLLWSYAGWAIDGGGGHWYHWLIDHWPYAKESLYTRGNVLKFAVLLPVVVSPIIFPGTCVGIWQNLRARADRCDQLIAAIPLVILAIHSVLYAFGKMASNGELRYMLIVAPFWGLLSARGWGWIAEQLQLKSVYRLAGIAALLPILANVAYPCVPLKLTDGDRAARTVADWYQQSSYAKTHPRVGTGHPTIYYFLGTIGTDPVHALDWRRDTLATPRPGTLLVWDSVYAVFNSDVNRSVPMDDLLQAGWVEITDQAPKLPENWHVLISPAGGDAPELPHSLLTP